MIGIVLLNLGGPDSLGTVKPFLYNLFSDREIIKLGPSFLQKPLAWLISTLRSPKTRKMYSLIGGKSPILEITAAQAKALEKVLNQNTEYRTQNTEEKSEIRNPKSEIYSLLVTRHFSLSFKVYIGMRYSPPFIKDTVDEILKDGIKHLIVLPLYPHYSRATTGSAISEFQKAISRYTLHATRYTLKYIEHWYDFPPYIDAVAELIAKGISEFATLPDILYSAHSLPQSFIDEGDPYLDHIKATIAAVNSLLITRYSLLFKWHLSFQSKSGLVKWLQPSTDKTIVRLAREGCKNLFIVPISFVSDHIETLYEIDILYRGLAEKHGINFKRCEALNTSEKFIDAIKKLIMTNIKTL